MYLNNKLRGGTGAATTDDADNDVFATSNNEKDDLQDGEEPFDASQMPDDYYFTGMIAFFCGDSLSTQSKKYIAQTSVRYVTAVVKRKG